MVQYQRNYMLMKKVADVDEDFSSNHMKKAKPKFLYLFFLSLISCSFILAAHLFTSSQTFFHLYSFRFEDEKLASGTQKIASIPSTSTHFNGTIFCDRSLVRSDVCTMTGDVRTDSKSSSIFLFGTKFNGVSDNNGGVIQREKIRPYTRKREKTIMSTIDELYLIVKTQNSAVDHRCDVRHDAPGLFFSTGGYTGNFFHEFTDGIVPLFITSQRFNGEVVFVILEYHHWWFTKYVEILQQLSHYDIIDFRRDNRTHCFPRAVVGLRAHNDLQIDPKLTEDKITIRDFREFLERTYSSVLAPAPLPEPTKKSKKPKLVIMARNDSRMIINQDGLIRLAQEIGFHVEVLVPGPTTNLATMYKILNSSDAMVGVHGAALTHFLFLRRGSVFIQIVPIGIDWAAETYCEIPAIKMGLTYIDYKIDPNESSLFDKYEGNDPVFTDSVSVNRKGWDFTKKTYLDHQNVRLNLGRFRHSLLRAHYYAVLKLNG